MGKKENMGFLGLCRKSGNLRCGHDAVKESIVSHKARLMIFSADISPRLEDEMNHLAEIYGADVPTVKTKCARTDFAEGIGIGSAVFSVTDNGFAQKLRMMFGEE